MNQNSPQPRVGRPKLPEDYRVPQNNDTALPWSYAEQELSRAQNYWIATVSPDGRPAVSPVWGAWIDGRLYFDGSPDTRRGRNIKQNPRVVVHLESGSQVVIVEGVCQILDGAPERALAEQVAAGYRAKYADQGYSPEPDQWDQGGLFIFEPQVGLGWTKFPDDMTRWKFGE